MVKPVAHQHSVERVVEHEEADVALEELVIDAERAAVAPQQIGLPAPRSTRAAEHSEDDRRSGQHEPPPRVQRLSVAVEALLLQRRGVRRWPKPVGQPHVADDDSGEQRAEDREQDEPGHQTVLKTDA
jgi:hypothetical protein